MRERHLILSFRLRLVLLYGLLVLLTLFLFRLVSVGVVERLLYADLDASLRLEAALVDRMLAVYPARGMSDAFIREELAERYRQAERKLFLEVLLADGSEYYRTPNLEPGELSAAGRLFGEGPETVFITGARDIRLLARRDTTHQIRVAFPLADIEAALSGIRRSFFLLTPLALLLVLLGGYLLVTRFMAPIRELDDFAQELLLRPIVEEVPSPRIRRMDELGRLMLTVTDLVRRLRESLRKVLAFSSLASHELRTPLAVMRSRLEAHLEGSHAPDALLRALRSTHEEVLRLGGITEGLLSLGRLNAGTFRLDKEEVQLGAFLEEPVEEARLLCEPEGILFQVEVEASAVVRLDPARMRLVVWNLLDNAIRHTPSGGRIRLAAHVEAARQEGEEEAVVIEVADTGSGIAPEIRDRVFDPFYRSGPDTPAGSSGLGLMLVRGIVEAHGGRIDLESIPGEGTAFRIRLPRR